MHGQYAVKKLTSISWFELEHNGSFMLIITIVSITMSYTQERKVSTCTMEIINLKWPDII